MDFEPPAAWGAHLDLGDVEAVALRLERCADAVEVQAVRARLGTTPTWRGGAADVHQERVTGLTEDLAALAARVRSAADLVRSLGATATARLSLLDAVEVGTGWWR